MMNINLSKPLSSIKSTHLFADYIELKALLTQELFTLGDLIDLIGDEKWNVLSNEDRLYLNEIKDKVENQDAR